MVAVMDAKERETFFGDRIVDAAEKAGLVRDVFDGVAERYDLMNDLMSFGVHRLWRKTMMDWLRPRPGMTLIDVAGGTGDIAFRFLDRVAGKAGGSGGVTVVDINEAMLDIGRDRAVDRGILQGLDWVCGDAEALPLGAARFDAFTVAFGIRNVTHIEHALAEARRVLKPGGRFLCLEFSRTVLPGLEQLYERYSFDILPALGGVVTGRREAYEYLVKSIRHFPDQEAFAAMIRAAGLAQVSYRNLSGGVAALHSGWRI
jgi:demethylmenaquinone methyltransferase/2-methoxy-6-polyprenyl-1,4-benzoquinol methylase